MPLLQSQSIAVAEKPPECVAEGEHQPAHAGQQQALQSSIARQAGSPDRAQLRERMAAAALARQQTQQAGHPQQPHSQQLKQSEPSQAQPPFPVPNQTKFDPAGKALLEDQQRAASHPLPGNVPSSEIAQPRKRHQQMQLDKMLGVRPSAETDPVIDLDTLVSRITKTGQEQLLHSTADMNREEAAKGPNISVQDQQTQPAEEISGVDMTGVDVVDLTEEGAGSFKGLHQAAASPSMGCPICFKTWPDGSISDWQLNEHVDQCLTHENIS